MIQEGYQVFPAHRRQHSVQELDISAVYQHLYVLVQLRLVSIYKQQLPEFFPVPVGQVSQEGLNPCLAYLFFRYFSQLPQLSQVLYSSHGFQGAG